MQNKILVRFLNSLVLLPITTLSMPVLGVSQPGIGMVLSSQIVSPKTENISVMNLLSFNQAKSTEHEIEAKTKELKAKAIDAYFDKYDMPLSGSGMKMVEEAEKNGLDYRLLPAIAVIESTGGKHACKGARHSFFGWGSCKINFHSVDHAIEIVAWNLGGNNPNTARYYAGKNTKQILRKYNPPHIVPRYAQKVMWVMSQIGAEDIGQEVLVKISKKDSNS